MEDMHRSLLGQAVRFFLGQATQIALFVPRAFCWRRTSAAARGMCRAEPCRVFNVGFQFGPSEGQPKSFSIAQIWCLGPRQALLLDLLVRLVMG